jgi:hypothetical protein
MSYDEKLAVKLAAKQRLAPELSRAVATAVQAYGTHGPITEIIRAAMELADDSCIRGDVAP